MQNGRKTEQQLLDELAQARQRIGELQAAEVKLQRVADALRISETQFRKITEKSIVGVYLIQDDLFRYVNPKMAEIFGYTVDELVDIRGPEDVVVDEDWPRVRDNLKKRIAGEMESINYSFSGKKSDGGPVHIEVYGSRMDYQGRPAVIGTILDMTQRIRAEQDLEVQLSRFQTLHHLAVAMTAERSLEDNLGLLVNKSRELLDADVSLIAVRDDKTGVMRVKATSGINKDGMDHLNHFLESAAEKRDSGDNPVYYWEEKLKEPLGSCKGENGSPMGAFKHLITSQVKIKETELGILCVGIRKGKYSSDSERDLLSLMGNMAALEIQRKEMEEALAQSEEQLRLLSRRLLSAQELERKRVARELHDGIGQSVTAMKFQVENVIRQASMSVPPENLAPLNSLVTMIQEVVEEVGRISMDLRPSILDDLGILATISWLCREFRKTRPDIQVEKEMEMEEGWVREDQKIVIFRILQEALNNAAKHSRANRVKIGLRRLDGSIALTIEDNGVGFDRDAVNSASGVRRGLGLAGMKERTQLSGGVLSVESKPGAGTSITASWPAP